MELAVSERGRAGARRTASLPRFGGVIGSVALLVACGRSASEPTPQPSPTPGPDSWYAAVVQCSNCPGLTNPQIDRTVTPRRARLSVGQLTSLRAAIREGCEPPQPALQVARWSVSDPLVIRVEPSSSESAIATALAPGIASITVERRLADGRLIQAGLKDAQLTSGCAPLPDLVFEIVP